MLIFLKRYSDLCHLKVMMIARPSIVVKVIDVYMYNQAANPHVVAVRKRLPGAL